MALDQAFRLSSILLAATSFAGLAMATVLPLWLLALGTVAFAAALLRLVERSGVGRALGSLRFSALTWNIFLLLAFAGFWVDFLLVSQELLPAGIHFLVTLLINKLFNLEQRRDFLHLYAISLMAILAAAALTSHIWYAPLFLGYLLSGVWTLLLYHLTKEKEESVAGPSQNTSPTLQPVPPGQITARFFWTTNAMAAGAFCLTLAFFFTIPRIGVGFLQKSHGESLRTTGFSEHVDLGVIGPVKHDPSVVMRVELPEGGYPGKSEPFYLRGVAYDRYNGKSWSNSLPHRRTLTELPPGTFTVRSSSTPTPQAIGRRIRQDVLLEALDTAVLFGAPLPVSVTGEFLTVQSDLMGALYLPFPAASRVQYTTYSVPRTLVPMERTATAFSYPEFIRQHYLQMPTSDPQVTDLARRVTQPASSIAEAVGLLRTHLMNSYRYSLEDFLFGRKTGYCEHYATAMVILLRSVGIPARLVTGFLATEWNEFGNYYTVRQRDAHAWVEVYFPQSGWITVDPTPPAIVAAPTTWWQSVGSAMDSVRLKWDRLFVHYSANDQMAVVQGLRESGDAMRARLSESLSNTFAPETAALGRLLGRLVRSDLKQAVLMILVVLLGAGYFFTMILRRAGWLTTQRDSLSANQRVAVTLYTEMLTCCSHRGIVKAASTTPREFLHQVRAHWSEALPSVEALTQLYGRVRFGRILLTPDDLATAQQHLRTLNGLSRSSLATPSG